MNIFHPLAAGLAILIALPGAIALAQDSGTVEATAAEAAAAKPAATEPVGAPKENVSPQPAASLTTAEALAAELAAAEAARPAVTYSTFAPGNLMPGGGLRQRSRRPGAALKSFRGMSQDLFKS